MTEFVPSEHVMALVCIGSMPASCIQYQPRHRVSQRWRMLPLLELIVPAHVVVRGPAELLQVPVQRPCDLTIPGIGGMEILQWPMIVPTHHSMLAASRPLCRSSESRLRVLESQV